MSQWLGEATISTADRVGDPAIKALTEANGIASTSVVVRSSGSCGVSVWVQLPAATSVTAYNAALTLLVAEVLSLPAGAALVDLSVEAAG